MFAYSVQKSALNSASLFISPVSGFIENKKMVSFAAATTRPTYLFKNIMKN